MPAVRPPHPLSWFRGREIVWTPGAVGLWLAEVALAVGLVTTLPFFVSIPLIALALWAGVYETRRTRRYESDRADADSRIHGRLDALDVADIRSRLQFRERLWEIINALDVALRKRALDIALEALHDKTDGGDADMRAYQQSLRASSRDLEVTLLFRDTFRNKVRTMTQEMELHGGHVAPSLVDLLDNATPSVEDVRLIREALYDVAEGLLK